MMRNLIPLPRVFQDIENKRERDTASLESWSYNFKSKNSAAFVLDTESEKDDESSYKQLLPLLPFSEPNVRHIDQIKLRAIDIPLSIINRGTCPDDRLDDNIGQYWSIMGHV